MEVLAFLASVEWSFDVAAILSAVLAILLAFQGYLFHAKKLRGHRDELLADLQENRKLVLQHVSAQERKVDSLHHKLNGLIQNQEAMLSMVVELESKLPKRANRVTRPAVAESVLYETERSERVHV